MLNQKIKNKIELVIQSKIIKVTSLSGGCISNAYEITMDSGESLFLKINSSLDDMFIKEANGLKELKKANEVRVPEVKLVEKEFILLEMIKSSSINKSFWEDFGKSFARMHRFSNSNFGFYEDNYIGSNPQQNINNKNLSWTDFYFNNRILFQYKLAEKNGYATDELKSWINFLECTISKILSGSEEPPSLLHGDLWSGNFMIDDKGDACIIDPAVYYGHREADLAMTKLFGGFNSQFYMSYNKEWKLKDGYEYRENIYKLYHVLNHLNLFGMGYYSQAISLIKSYK
jgi:fructosamine-3-kinase